MKLEAPEFKRCCCCIPLRGGLIGWGYFRVALNILMALYLFSGLWVNVQYLTGKDFIVFGLIFLPLAIDVAFTVVLIVAGHKKNRRLLKVCYIYFIVTFVLFLVSSAFIVYKEIEVVYDRWQSPWRERFISFCLIVISSHFVGIFTQVYIILLVRSEGIKLEKQSLEMQFVNHAAEAEASCVRAPNEHTNVKHMNNEYDNVKV